MTPRDQRAPRRRVRAGTVVWGAILVAGATLALIELLGGPLNSLAVLWGVAGFGGVLIVAAVVTAVLRGASDAREPESSDEEHPSIG